MKSLINRYESKLKEQGLCDNDILIADADNAGFVTNKSHDRCSSLFKVLEKINGKTIIFSGARDPYRSIINYISKNADRICAEDSETRLLLSDIPIIDKFSVDAVVNSLGNRKCAIVRGEGLLVCGKEGVKEAFLVFSSVCFACYVKFFVDYYYSAKENKLNDEQKKIFNNAVKEYDKFGEENKNLSIKNAGPFKNEAKILDAMAEAGRLTIESRLVNSFFGNISVRSDDGLYITETGSALDDLDGHIVKCSLEDTPCAKASSELPAHREIYRKTKYNSILHGHPRFAVIMSMICDDLDCKFRGECYIKCPKERFINDIPIVPGEVGGGRYGLSNTVPNAINDKRGVIVYGHGIFTTGENKDFNKPFQNLLDIERMCFKTYILQVK
ncbi:MAG: class II aldolase/adducin family protein [Elusimicrobiota bacterium]